MTRRQWRHAWVVAIGAAVGLARAAHAQDATLPLDSATAAERAIALQLQNPLAPIRSLPLQANFEYDVGPAKGYRFTLAAIPGVPFRLSKEWTIFSRTVVPFIAQRDAVGQSGGQFGLADVVESVFLTPTPQGVATWGAGVVALLPLASDPLLGTSKWGLGPTGALVRQSGPWTVGGIANHLWSVAGASDRPPVNATYLQPFAAWTSATALTVSGNLEATYDWTSSRWTQSLNIGASQVVTVNARSANVGLFSRTYPGGPEGAPRWGVRFVVTLVFPRGEERS